MAQTEMTCILCPMGCRLVVSQDAQGVQVRGNSCKRGAQYGEQEWRRPMRVVTSSVRVDGGRLPLCPIKTQGQVPKSSIGQVLSEIKRVRIQAPVRIGQVLIQDVAGMGIPIVATANR